MDRRLQLHEILKTLCDNVYFQAPPADMLKYPCIMYALDNVDIQHANNSPYRRAKRYVITVIDQDPDSEIPDKVSSLPSAAFSRHFTADNLNHDVYTIYY